MADPAPMSEHRITLREHGGPEVLEWSEFDPGPPRQGEVRVRTRAIGLNYIYVYVRTGQYPRDVASGLGYEAAGTGEALGPGVTGLAVGQRVGTSLVLGTYATVFNAPADLLVPLPDSISDETAAAILLKGSTVEALVERCARVQPGSTVLVHAAAGGVGLLMVQWLRHIGARVIATAGGEAKGALAERAGADHVIDYAREDVAARVRGLTGGLGVPVVFDGVGRATWPASLAACARRGLIVSFGNASGPVTNVALGSLASAGSLFVTRPSTVDYLVEPAERTACFGRIFTLIDQGALDIRIGQRFALKEAAEAHRALESRATTGSTVLIP